VPQRGFFVVVFFPLFRKYFLGGVKNHKFLHLQCSSGFYIFFMPSGMWQIKLVGCWQCKNRNRVWVKNSIFNLITIFFACSRSLALIPPLQGPIFIVVVSCCSFNLTRRRRYHASLCWFFYDTTLRKREQEKELKRSSNTSNKVFQPQN
jgi:hypothetical protein